MSKKSKTPTDEYEVQALSNGVLRTEKTHMICRVSYADKKLLEHMRKSLQAYVDEHIRE
jgi:hypothetical protein